MRTTHLGDKLDVLGDVPPGRLQPHAAVGVELWTKANTDDVLAVKAYWQRIGTQPGTYTGLPPVFVKNLSWLRLSSWCASRPIFKAFRYSMRNFGIGIQSSPRLAHSRTFALSMETPDLAWKNFASNAPLTPLLCSLLAVTVTPCGVVCFILSVRFKL